MSFTSKILITGDFESIKEQMIKDFGKNNLRFIPKNPAVDFLMDDARAVGKESYIAEQSEKIIIIMANAFRVEAQNFLLKLFEEPPKNVKFLIVCPSKNLLLPTVRSRFICEILNKKKTRSPLAIDLVGLDYKKMLEFLQENETLDKITLQEMIANFALQSSKTHALNERDLEFFYKAYELARLNGKASVILATLLLNLYESKK
ncbi:DNA polymerase III subunit delta' [Campylobacter troglodytis]|nr:DNA polymerase III subunit delta' [Campylobacter troglodytis]